MENKAIQNTIPTLKKNQDICWFACVTHAIGTNMFHTIGINQAGFICFISNEVFLIHIDNIFIVIKSCIKDQIAQIRKDICILIFISAILINIKLIENVGKNCSLILLLNSLFTSSR